MRKLLATVTAMLLMGSVAIAQETSATANSASGSQASSSSQANGGTAVAQQAVLIDQRSPGTVQSRLSGETTTNYRQSGTVRNEFAPAVQAPAMGSGHPCGLGNSLGISIIGGGVTGGATRVDDACLLAQMGKTTAAMVMIAARSSTACSALVSSGDISPDSVCGDGSRKEGGIFTRNNSTGPVVKQPNGKPIAVGQRPNAGNVAPELAAASSRGPVCFIKTGTKRTVVTNATTQQAKMACAASLGM